MGMLAGGFFADKGVGGNVLLDTQWNLNSFDDGLLSVTSISFNPDGSLTAVYNDTSDIPATDNWWTGNPETNIGASYEVAYTAITGGAWATGPSINVWTNMGSTVTYSVRALAKDTPTTVVANGVTFEIRPAGGGASLATLVCNHSASN